jgi:hypothetical protein
MASSQTSKTIHTGPETLMNGCECSGRETEKQGKSEASHLQVAADHSTRCPATLTRHHDEVASPSRIRLPERAPRVTRNQLEIHAGCLPWLRLRLVAIPARGLTLAQSPIAGRAAPRATRGMGDGRPRRRRRRRNGSARRGRPAPSDRSMQGPVAAAGTDERVPKTVIWTPERAGGR